MDAKLMTPIEALVEEYRDRCLGFLREDFLPRNLEEAMRALDLIERYGDRAGFVRAQRLRKWLLHSTSAES